MVEVPIRQNGPGESPKVEVGGVGEEFLEADYGGGRRWRFVGGLRWGFGDEVGDVG